MKHKIQEEIKQQFLGKDQHTNRYKLAQELDRTGETIKLWMKEKTEFHDSIIKAIGKVLKLKKSQIILK